MTDSCSVEMVELVEEFTCSSTTSLVTPHSVPAPSSHLRGRRAVLLAAAATARLPSLLLALVLHLAPCSIPCRGPGGAPMAAKVNPARCTGRAGGKGRREERKVSGAAGARVRLVSGAWPGLYAGFGRTSGARPRASNCTSGAWLHGIYSQPNMSSLVCWSLVVVYTPNQTAP